MSRSEETLSPTADYAGWARNLAGPIDDDDPDSSELMGNKFADLARRGHFAKSEEIVFETLTPLKRNFEIEKKVEVCVWVDFPKPVVEQILDIKTFSELKKYIHKFFNLDDFKDVLKENAMTDLYSYAVQFARRNKLEVQQVSTLLAIIKKVHSANIENPFDNLKQCFGYFKKLLLCHSVHRPPFWADIFDSDVAELIMNYMMNTYFKHFRLYKCAFTPEITLDLDIYYPYSAIGSSSISHDYDSIEINFDSA